jgi:hypothetical protein
MAYTATYSQGDLSKLVIDIVGAVFNAIIQNVALLVLLVILGVIVFMCRGLISNLFGMIKLK